MRIEKSFRTFHLDPEHSRRHCMEHQTHSEKPLVFKMNDLYWTCLPRLGGGIVAGRKCRVLDCVIMIGGHIKQSQGI
jgi:hypothetical protein